IKSYTLPTGGVQPSPLLPLKSHSMVERCFMFRISLLLLVAATAVAQTTSSSSQNPSSATTAKSAQSDVRRPTSSPTATDNGESVPAKKTVLTMHGICSAAQKEKTDRAACATRMTKEEFEWFIEALRSTGQMLPPSLPAAMRRTIAQNYVAIR